MKRIFVLSIITFMLFAAVPVTAADASEKLQAIIGPAENIIAENFSGVEPMFSGKAYYKNDITSVPGWGMVASGSEMTGIDVSDLGEKNYVIPRTEGQLKQDIGIKIKASEKKPGRALLDVWNIPLANINGTEKYRFEYNVYIQSNGMGEGLIADVSTYAVDVPGATKAFGIIGFMRDGTVGLCKKSLSTYDVISDANGNPARYKNNAWNHVVLDFNIEKGVFDFHLNGDLLLSGAKPANPILFHATEGAYRFRMAFTPHADDPESFVVYDDILFAKHVKNEKMFLFSHLMEKDGSVNFDLKNLSPMTEAVCFKNASGVKDGFVKITENGKEIETVLSEKDGILFVQPKKVFLPDKNYEIIFDRFASADGKTFSTEPTVFLAYCHSAKIHGVLNGELLEITATCAESKTVYFYIVKYNQDGTMSEIRQSDAVAMKAGTSQKTTVPLDGFTWSENDTIQIVVREGLNKKPLCNAVTLQ